MIMNIVACIKQVVDVSQVKVDESTQQLILKGIPFKTSDFDKNAMEEAIKIKEKLNGKLTVMTLGSASASESIREALAMGADEGIILSDPSFENLDASGVAVVLAAGINKLGQVDLVLCGEAAIDTYAGQVGPMLAEQLGMPTITYATEITAEADKVSVDRDIGDKTMTVESGFPVLVTATKELNEPRLPNMMQILAAANKKVDTWGAGDLGIAAGQLSNNLTTGEVKGFQMDRKKIMIDGEPTEQVEKLIDYIKTTLGS
jgi:electron transfer flavoprotein beta subunit